MTVEVQHGKRRPRAPRPGEHTLTADAVLAGPMRDPHTGRWLPGNQGSRLRALKTIANLTTLTPATCAPWARPFVTLARDEASRLVVEAGGEASPSLAAFAEDAATALAMHRAFMAEAVAPGVGEARKLELLAEARMWMKERRQSLLSLRAEARAGIPHRREGDGVAALKARIASRAKEGT